VKNNDFLIDESNKKTEAIWVEFYESNDKYIDIKNILNKKGEEVSVGVIMPTEHTQILNDIIGTVRRKIVSIEGIYEKNATSEFYKVIPGDQYCGIKIVVKVIDTSENNEYDEEYIFKISNYQNCCESWGVCLSEDDLLPYYGAELIDIYFTDTSLKTTYLNHIALQKNSYDFHNIQFINFKTDKGIFQLTVYNCHNGYYGHDVTIIRNGCEKIYETRI